MEQATLSVAEVALASGFARQSIHRAIRDGRLNRWLIRDSKGRARLAAEVVVAIRQGGLLGLRVDTKQPAPAPPPVAAPAPVAALPSWGLMAPWANAQLAVEAWNPPPWTAEQWLTLEVVTQQAEELAIELGEWTPEKWADVVERGEDDE